MESHFSWVRGLEKTDKLQAILSLTFIIAPLRSFWIGGIHTRRIELFSNMLHHL